MKVKDKIRNAYHGIISEFNTEHYGFSGITHWLIAICFFQLMWLIPLSFVQSYISSVNENIVMLIMTFFIIGGASLLPDLDSSPLQEGGSTAVYQLGALGYGLSILAITISGVVYNVIRTKYDEKPKSQHRMLFHTLFIPIAIFVYVNFFLELPNGKIIDSISDGVSGDEYSILILIFFSGISAYLGASMIIYKVLKLFKQQKYTQFVCLATMAGVIAFMVMSANGAQIRLIGTSIALGYFFHNIADEFSKGSIPMFFPIPVPRKLSKIKELQFWKKPRIPFALTTGGIANTILNFLMFFADAFLFYMIFIRK